MIYFPNQPQEKSLGSSIGEALSALAQGKATQLHRRHQESNAEEALTAYGFSPAEAKQLSKFDPQILREVIKNKGKQPSEAYVNALNTQYGGNKQGQQSPLEALRGNQGSQNAPEQKLDMAQLLQQLSTNPGALQLGGLGQQSNSQFQPIQQQAAPQQQLAQPQEPRIDWAGLKPEERRELYKIQREKLKDEEERARNRFKDTKEVRKEVLAKGAQARENLESLDRLEDLNKNGNLNSNEYLEFLKGVGLDIPSMMTADTQEFNKITSNFIRGAKAIFGSRVTEKELQYYLQTIPQMSNSPEGRQRVILNLKKLARGEREMVNTYKEILKENGGVPPHDIAEQLEDRSEKKLDAIARQFKKELENPFPKRPASIGSSGIRGLDVTAGSLLGKAIGRIPAGAAGAVAGGVAGSAIPVLGTIPGAIIGGLAGLSGLSVPRFK